MKILKGSEMIRYIMTGGITTAINYIVYFVLQAARVDYVAANCAAWLGAVTFAFFANRQVVFRSKGSKRREFAWFFSLRLGTLAAETILLCLMVEAAGLGSAASKIFVSFVTTALNYIACKYGVFKERRVYHE